MPLLERGPEIFPKALFDLSDDESPWFVAQMLHPAGEGAGPIPDVPGNPLLSALEREPREARGRGP